MANANDGGKKRRGTLVSVVVLVTLMLAGSYIATMDQAKDVSALLPVQRVPIQSTDPPKATAGSTIPDANQPEATAGSAMPGATAEPSKTPDAAEASEFLEYRGTIAGTRSSAAALLDEVISDASASAETVQQALKRKSELAVTMAMETEMETLLKAKGFSDVLCTINSQSVNIVVRCGSLSQQQASQIMDIAISVTGRPASHVKIIPSE